MTDNNTGTGSALAVGKVSDRKRCEYTGEDGLAGITAEPITGYFWIFEGLGLFQPEGTNKVFEVAENDIKYLS